MPKIKNPIEKQPRFNSLVEVLEDAICADFINKELERIESSRERALATAPKGTRLRRSSWDDLNDRGMLHPAGLVHEFELIDKKKSNLPASSRSLITDICLTAMRETIEYWDKIDSHPVKKPKLKRKSPLAKV